MSEVSDPVRQADDDSTKPVAQSVDVALLDWDTLFDAVVKRLKSSFESQGPSGLSDTRKTWGEARASVMECAQALDQLHQTAINGFAHHRQLEAETLAVLLGGADPVPRLLVV